MMPLGPSDAQLMATVLCPKFTAAASVVGSSLIIRDIIILRRNSSDALSTRHRLLAGMSVCDILSSSAWFLTSWPVPEDLPFGLWNVGNRHTCTAQGFFVQLAIGTVLYNACLALYYLLVIRYGWKNEYIAKRVEPWMHFAALAFALSTGVAGVALDIFNPIGFGFSCSITSFSPVCTQSNENRSPTDCIHGDNADVYQAAFWIGPAGCIIVWLAASMFLVYWKIRTIESGSSHFQSQPGRLQQRFALQAFLYVGAMLITWGPMLGVYIHREIASKPPKWWVSRSIQIRLEVFISRRKRPVTIQGRTTTSVADLSILFLLDCLFTFPDYLFDDIHATRSRMLQCFDLLLQPYEATSTK
jgi:hypothetical protein